MNNLDNFFKDLSKYSDKDLYQMAKILNIDNPNIYNRKLLKLKIATIQFNKYSNSNLDINIPQRGTVTITETCMQGYEIKNLLGKGTYGSVHLAINPKNINPNKKYAIKFQNLYVDKNKFPDPITYQKLKNFLRQDFLDEVNISELFSKYSIGPIIYHAWICEDIDIGVTVTEFWDKAANDINELCNLNPELVKKLRNQIIKIHNLDYIHYDIKPANILIKKDYLGNIIDITLTDFGLSLKRPKVQDSLVFYNYHKNIAPNFYKNITLQMVKKNPIIFDYGVLYEIEKCNPNVTLGFYPIKVDTDTYTDIEI
jgi:serine/threonine protein kinase